MIEMERETMVFDGSKSTSIVYLDEMIPVFINPTVIYKSTHKIVSMPSIRKIQRAFVNQSRSDLIARTRYKKYNA
jgi:hypothetical protein